MKECDLMSKIMIAVFALTVVFALVFTLIESYETGNWIMFLFIIYLVLYPAFAILINHIIDKKRR